jgi:hypothetical protein
MAVRPRYNLAKAVFVTTMVAGCAGGGAQIQPLNVPENPSIGALPEPTAVAIDEPIGSATELYSRVARGAMSCWFAVGGPLKKDYIYQATADAPSRGGKAEIVIRRRDPIQPNPRGVKSYLVEIEPKGNSAATIKTENLKMPEAFASAMTDDVTRWSKGDQGCIGASTAVGWAPAPPETAKPVAQPQRKIKQKSQPASAQTKADAKP